ncbi:MAG: PAS domain-containing protein [Flavobacteriales bacterium]|nr:PAS domain-containing protein [Flavobacteriales bacterium]
MQPTMISSAHLLESLPHKIIEVDPADHSITYVNHYKGMYSAENVLGRPVFDFILLAYHDRYSIYAERAIKENKTMNFELEALSAKGKNWYMAYVTPFKNELGQLRLSFILEDIQDRKDVEFSALLKDYKLRAIMNTTQDGVLSLDRHLRIAEFNEVMNKNFQANTGKELIKGIRIIEYIDPKILGHQTSVFDRVFNGEKISEVELYEVDGKPNFFENHYHPVIDANGEVIGISVLSRNIHQRIKREEQLKETLRQKENLLYEVHHRVKNNLAIISSLVELQEIVAENNHSRDALQKTRQRIKSTALIHELLYEKANFEMICLNTYLKNLFEMLRVSSGCEEVEIEIKGDQITIPGRIAVSVGLLFNELFTNSFKHGFCHVKTGNVAVELIKNDEFVRIEMEESLSGFPEEVDIQTISTTGWTIIRSFLEQLNGTIALTKNPNTHFSIVFSTK